MRRAGLLLLLIFGSAVAQNTLIEYSPDEVFIFRQRVAALEAVERARAEVELLSSERNRLMRALERLDPALDEEVQGELLGALDRAASRADENLVRVQQRHDEIQTVVREIAERYNTE